ncbi:alpha/beta hydrolase [Shimazuella sp. AN120528]|uniref:alpha/beta fold hydrolase n=1 Tax=Shimazuella soli TaxID=1892854 RepID=UPI001F0D1ED0|nr:alpha/beta hydrolase [Shimazuella soli]MCH5584493.1 alpha/beta hydrolase [Shimazuella soli]
MHSVISKDGTKIVYEKVGHGPSLVLVTGAFSYREFPAQIELAQLLSSRFTVYYYDRRGRGDSEDTMPYDVEREYEDLEALIEEAGGSSYVWGLSSGAVIALQTAARGANITKLALHEVPFVVDTEGHTAPENFAEHVKNLISEDRRAEAIKYFMTKGMGAPSFVIAMMRLMPGVWSKLMNVAHTLPYDAALLDGYMEGKPLPVGLWNTVTMPTLVLAGTESPIALRHGARALAKNLPNAALVSKKGLGHTKKLQTSKIANELLAFFN